MSAYFIEFQLEELKDETDRHNFCQQLQDFLAQHFMARVWQDHDPSKSNS